MMNLGVGGSSGVPTTPVPLKAAPSPRYNDLTRPRSLQLDGGAAVRKAPAGSGRFWDSSANAGGGQLLGLDTVSPGACRSVGASLSNNVSGSDFPPPWQGSFTLPDSDEEMVNSAQTWIAQILHESCEDVSGDVDFVSDVLADGRVLCRVANAIASGSVGVIQEDSSSSSNASNMCNFLVACRNFGVPKGALFDIDHRDPKLVALCLHVLNRVVQDTVPDFSGPFLVRFSRTRSGNNNIASDDDSASAEDIHSQANSHLHQCRQNPAPHPASTNLASSDEDDPNPSKCYRSSVEDVYNQQEPQTSSAEEGPQVAASLPRCPPPSHAAPNPQQQALFWPPDPPSPSGAFFDMGLSMERSAAPGQRPLSLPSRLSRTAQAVDTTWGLLPLRAGVAGSRDGEDKGPGVACIPAATWHASAATLERGRQAEIMGHQLAGNASFKTPAASAASLSCWLSKLNLSSFEEALSNIGVATLDDLRYVEEEDLRTIGMHGPQIRKFLLNRPCTERPFSYPYPYDA